MIGKGSVALRATPVANVVAEGGCYQSPNPHGQPSGWGAVGQLTGLYAYRAPVPGFYAYSRVYEYTVYLLLG